MKQVGLQLDKALNKDAYTDNSARAFVFPTLTHRHIVAVGGVTVVFQGAGREGQGQAVDAVRGWG